MTTWQGSLNQDEKMQMRLPFSTPSLLCLESCDIGQLINGRCMAWSIFSPITTVSCISFAKKMKVMGVLFFVP